MRVMMSKTAAQKLVKAKQARTREVDSCCSGGVFWRAYSKTNGRSATIETMTATKSGPEASMPRCLRTQMFSAQAAKTSATTKKVTIAHNMVPRVRRNIDDNQ